MGPHPGKLTGVLGCPFEVFPPMPHGDFDFDLLGDGPGVLVIGDLCEKEAPSALWVLTVHGRSGGVFDQHSTDGGVPLAGT